MVADAPPRMHLVLFTGGAAEVFERGRVTVCAALCDA